jgi:glycosyltransferase involved in cell wall biosynthesis
MGRLKPDKGIFDALELASVMARSRRFTLAAIGGPVGEENPWWNEIQQRATRVSENGGIVFVDYTPDPIGYLSAGDIYVLLSHDEGFNRTIIEAMALGKPCVVTNVGGNAEAVDDGITGTVVEVGDITAAANAVLRLIDDVTIRRVQGEMGRKRVEKLFAVEAMRDAVRDIILQTASSI